MQKLTKETGCSLVIAGGEGKEVAEQVRRRVGLVAVGWRVAWIWRVNAKSGWVGVSWD